MIKRPKWYKLISEAQWKCNGQSLHDYSGIVDITHDSGIENKFRCNQKHFVFQFTKNASKLIGRTFIMKQANNPKQTAKQNNQLKNCAVKAWKSISLSFQYWRMGCIWTRTQATAKRSYFWKSNKCKSSFVDLMNKIIKLEFQGNVASTFR